MAFEFLKSKPTEKLNPRDFIIMGSAVLLCLAIYLITAKATYAIGFPLDDSWIHQTYARNFAANGEWVYRPGIRSAGSTSPLWTLLLVPGYLIHVSPYFWTFSIGAVFLFALAILFESTARNLLAAYRPVIPWIGVYIIFAWQLSWSAVSGMETIGHAFLVTLVLILLLKGSRAYVQFGLLVGLSIWNRPDGITLIGPILMVMLINSSGIRYLTHDLGLFVIGFASLFVPYLLFNLYLDGTPWPNTFYAKQAEYAAWQSTSIINKTGLGLLQFLVGSGFLLVPGVVSYVYKSYKRRSREVLSVVLWMIGYMILYISRLPPYQHGRYLIPAMPIFFLVGFFGLIEFIKSDQFGHRHWMVQATWIASLAAVGILFVIIGAQSYAQDVSIIESEMVKTARWADANLPGNTLIAAHDIGALGFFDDHAILDLAGLISPDVIPFIRDEPKLADYMDLHGADYLIAFPEFYPVLTRNLKIVYSTASPFAPSYGAENMAIYRWGSSK